LGILRDRLKRLSGVAEENSVYLALEDHGSISLTPDGLFLILNMVNSDWVGVNFDTANIHRGNYVGTDKEGYEWKLGAVSSYSEVELLKKVVGKVKHLHIKDVIGRDAVILGDGEIDLMGCLRILKEAEFNGVLSYETEGWQDAEESVVMITKSRQFLIDALQDLQSQG
jgi:sugar phosphate isomerase/epimerase